MVWKKEGWPNITIDYKKNGQLGYSSRENMKKVFGLSEKEFRLFQISGRIPEKLLQRCKEPVLIIGE